MGEKMWDGSLRSGQTTRAKRSQLCEDELEELREHIDLISFKIGKVYRHAKDRSRKGYNEAKHALRRKLGRSYQIE